MAGRLVEHPRSRAVLETQLPPQPLAGSVEPLLKRVVQVVPTQAVRPEKLVVLAVHPPWSLVLVVQQTPRVPTRVVLAALWRSRRQLAERPQLAPEPVELVDRSRSPLALAERPLVEWPGPLEVSLPRVCSTLERPR